MHDVMNVYSLLAPQIKENVKNFEADILHDMIIKDGNIFSLCSFSCKRSDLLFKAE